ncbi:class I SAM-dependent methyltransferase [Marmoricola endophyticus]|uniref:class I SAM-dependent methyltransferase n=1 Tax=Marmoricola endophyticus TaxID=2040280 RepID=UPI0016632194|nr:class I SAM-dependent methyltransferase [Marmoricola endophyticus]
MTATYDETRGGAERAAAAAVEVAALASARGRCLDVAGGTGTVAAELTALGHDVVVVDRSRSMLALAAQRLPGRTVLADAARLPMPPGSADLVLTLWLLHLLPDPVASRVVAEVARVLAPGGTWVTSVDKADSHGRGGADEPDAEHRVAERARALGLSPVGTAHFRGRTRWGTAAGGDVATFRLAAFAPGEPVGQ